MDPSAAADIAELRRLLTLPLAASDRSPSLPSPPLSPHFFALHDAPENKDSRDMCTHDTSHGSCHEMSKRPGACDGSALLHGRCNARDDHVVTAQAEHSVDHPTHAAIDGGVMWADQMTELSNMVDSPTGASVCHETVFMQDGFSGCKDSLSTLSGKVAHVDPARWPEELDARVSLSSSAAASEAVTSSWVSSMTEPVAHTWAAAEAASASASASASAAVPLTLTFPAAADLVTPLHSSQSLLTDSASASASAVHAPDRALRCALAQSRVELQCARRTVDTLLAQHRILTGQLAAAQAELHARRQTSRLADMEESGALSRTGPYAHHGSLCPDAATTEAAQSAVHDTHEDQNHASSISLSLSSSPIQSTSHKEHDTTREGCVHRAWQDLCRVLPRLQAELQQCHTRSDRLEKGVTLCQSYSTRLREENGRLREALWAAKASLRERAMLQPRYEAAQVELTELRQERQVWHTRWDALMTEWTATQAEVRRRRRGWEARRAECVALRRAWRQSCALNAAWEAMFVSSCRADREGVSCHKSGGHVTDQRMACDEEASGTHVDTCGSDSSTSTCIAGCCDEHNESDVRHAHLHEEEQEESAHVTGGMPDCMHLTNKTTTIHVPTEEVNETADTVSDVVLDCRTHPHSPRTASSLSADDSVSVSHDTCHATSALARMLEAKVVDLTLRLHDAEMRVCATHTPPPPPPPLAHPYSHVLGKDNRKKEDTNTDKESEGGCVPEHGNSEQRGEGAMELRAMVALMRPLTERYAAENAALRAAHVVSEGCVAALLDRLAVLYDAWMEEMLHAHALESAAVGRGEVRECGAPKCARVHDDVGGGIAAARRPTGQSGGGNGSVAMTAHANVTRIPVSGHQGRGQALSHRWLQQHVSCPQSKTTGK